MASTISTRHQVHAVVEEVIFAQGGVAAGFDGQRAVDALAVEAHGLVDDVAVAALKAVMHAAPFGDETAPAREEVTESVTMVAPGASYPAEWRRSARSGGCG